MPDNQHTELIPAINESLDLNIPGHATIAELESVLADQINSLINTHFEKLVYYLYRIDVNEQKMRNVLDGTRNTDAGLIIARMIIDRQLEKIKSRQETRQDNIVDEDEKW